MREANRAVRDSEVLGSRLDRRPRSTGRRLGCPIQRAAYLGAGRPVVVAADAESEAALVDARSGCGLRIAPRRANLLAESLCLLGADTARWRTCASSGPACANAHWEKEPIVRRIEAALLAIAPGNLRREGIARSAA